MSAIPQIGVYFRLVDLLLADFLTDLLLAGRSRWRGALVRPNGLRRHDRTFGVQGNFVFFLGDVGTDRARPAGALSVPTCSRSSERIIASPVTGP
jgi:hypothetical protein